MEHPGKDIVAVWLATHTPLANVVRTLEARIFPEVPNLATENAENKSLFLALVDTREGAERIVHCTRLTGASAESNQDTDSNTTGLIGIDEVIGSDQNFSARDFYDYYEKDGTNITSCLSVETNFRVGERVGTNNGLRISDLGYVAVFNMLERGGAEVDKSYIFAFFNEGTIKSLSAIGIVAEPLAGRGDLKAPSDEAGKFDKHYKPAAIKGTQQSLAAIRAIQPYAAPELVID